MGASFDFRGDRKGFVKDIAKFNEKLLGQTIV